MNMIRLNKAAIVILVTLLTAGQLRAQRILGLSARQAVDTALKNVTAIKNLQLDRKIQLAQNREITGRAYPQLNGNLSLSHYFSIPVTSLPDFISPSVYDVLTKNNVNGGNGIPIVAPNSYAVIPAQFGVPWTASAGFAFEQLIFQSDVFVGLKARSASLQYADYNIKIMEDSIRGNVYRSYYSVLIVAKRLVFVNESLLRLEKLLHDQNEMYKNGFAERLDIDRTQVNLNNLKTTQSQLSNLVQLGTEALKFAMAVPVKDSLVLTDTLSTDQVKSDLLEDGGFRYEDREEYNLLSTVQRLQQLDVKRNKLAYVPTMSAFWNYSRNAQRQKFNFFNTNEQWFPASVVGLNISIPIFDGFQKQSRIQQARLNVEKTTNTIENLQRAVDFERKAARIQVTNALASLDVQERNLELAESVYNKTKIKFEQGVGSSFEIIQAEISLEESQSNYFQSLYDAVIAKLDYTKALGRL
ncbi:MAG: TolC family protein [Chitinophagaceae bacterium]